MKCPHCTNADTRMMESAGVDLKRGIQMILCTVCSKKFEYNPNDTGKKK